MPFQRKKLSYSEALLKARSFCAYQERAHSEVKEKLYSFGMFKDEVDLLMEELIQSNFLNEERFAQAFVSGKFNLKHWGRIKIVAHLKQKGVSEYCIRIGLREIVEEEYLLTIRQLAQKKLELLTPANELNQKVKLAHFLIGKGFETDLVWLALKELFSE